MLVGLFFFFDHYVIGKDPVVFSFSNLQIRRIWWSNDQLVSMGRQYLTDRLIIYHKPVNFFTTSDVYYIATKAEGAMESMINASNNDLEELRHKLDEFLQKEAKELRDIRVRHEVTMCVRGFISEVIAPVARFIIGAQIIFAVLAISYTLK